MKSGLEKISMKFLHGQILFYFIERSMFASNCKVSNKNDLLCARRDFNKTFSGRSKYNHKWTFKLQISSIFHFDRVSDGWMAQVLEVKGSKYFLNLLQPIKWKYLYKKNLKIGPNTFWIENRNFHKEEKPSYLAHLEQHELF